MTKKCKGGCNRSLPATNEYFYANRKKIDRLCDKCIECTSEYSKKRAKEKKDYNENFGIV